MGEVISFVGQKGGTGKSTLARAFAVEAARAQTNVLIADLDDAQRLCDRVAVIHAGRIVAEGSPADLIARSASTTTITLRTQPAVHPEWLAAIHGSSAIQCNGALASFSADDANRALAQLIELLNARHVEVIELHAQRATLEAVVASLL
jgi:ABC-type multidrug transport system ATPase subunit